MRETQAFTREQYSDGDIIVIYGAGVYGEIAHAALEEIGLTPNYYCDDSYMKESGVCRGVRVVQSDELYQFKDAVIIIASYNYFGEMIKKCKQSGCKRLYDMETILQRPLNQKKLSGRAIGRLNDVDGYKAMLERGVEGDEVFVNHIEFVVCETCTLRCRDCANLISSYKNPEILDSPEYYDAMDRLMNLIDKVGEVYLIGGEPFLHPRLRYIIEKFAAYANSGGLTIFSNGTVLPNKEILETIKKYHVKLQISDYHLRQQKLEELSAILNEWEISYVIKKYEEWISLGDFSYRRRSKREEMTSYTGCFFRKLYTLHRGKLFNCPRSAHAAQQGLLGKGKFDSLDFSREDGLPSKEELKDYLEQVIPRNQCKYCNGGNLSGETIPAAIQKQGDMICV